MPVNLASPGIRVREVDLTIGRVDTSSALIGAIVAPFSQGPVEFPSIVGSEKTLLENFGRPYSNDKHYENWLVASSYLAYGGSLMVTRADDASLSNAYVGSGASIKIKSDENYEQLQYVENVIGDRTIVARNPGSWANGIRIGIIDAKVDQVLDGIDTTAINGGSDIAVGMGVTQTLVGRTDIGAGTTSALDGYLKGIVTEVGTDSIGVKVLSHVSAAGIEYIKDYQESGVWAFSNTGSVAIHTTGQNVSYGSTSYTGQSDWFGTQTIAISASTAGGTISTSSQAWNTLADRPGTTAFAAERGSRFDEVHVIVIDGEGKITGNAGTILEKHLNLSKASNAEFSVGTKSYWRSFIKNNSQYIFGGDEPAGVTTTGYSTGFTLSTGNSWDQSADSVIFAASGNQNLVLSRGKNYDGNEDLELVGSLNADLNKLVDGYSLFESKENYDIDFLLMGSGNYDKEVTQALANKLIAVADIRKDSLAFISPHRRAFINDTDAGSVTVNDSETITNNVLSFYSPITSSSYAVFDSGYKYMFDRFSNTFRYVPLNGDIAGLCARTDNNNFPWFSPAGLSRGSILNAVKLTYNPTQAQRNRLFSARINPVIVSPGGGINLFGDKTGLARSSAFDRINVRRLFIFLEEAISGAARDQLFEFNDQVTRSTFVSIVDPFLRDVQAKRGIQDYVVICDETNNTAAIIDNNEFVADIFVKPNRSINFIGLTFVATRTGVSFEEVVGNV
jgi:hypothetical protein